MRGLAADRGWTVDDYKATTHWLFIPCLKRFPKIKVVEGHPRFVIDRDRITCGGISSGLDESLALIELLAGREIAERVQLFAQYYPQPPVCRAIPAEAKCPVNW